MNKKFYIDGTAYNSLLGLLNDLHLTESKGNINDFAFYHNDLWLSDTAVIEQLYKKRGEWNVALLFALYNNPLKFIKRQITSYSCPNKARLTATLMRRLAAKDQRGTLQVDIKNLNLSPN